MPSASLAGAGHPLVVLPSLANTRLSHLGVCCFRGIGWMGACLKALSGRLEFRLGLLGPRMPCLSAIPQVDAEAVVGLAQSLEPLKGTKEESLDEALLRRIALSSAGTLSPMAAILGGVAAQEVLKVE